MAGPSGRDYAHEDDNENAPAAWCSSRMSAIQDMGRRRVPKKAQLARYGTQYGSTGALGHPKDVDLRMRTRR